MENGGLEQLKKKLYKPGEIGRKIKRVRILGGKDEVPPPTSWENLKSKEGMPRLLKVIFLIAGIFFAFSVAIFLYFWLKGSNIVSNENIVIDIRGPAYVQGGELVNMDIYIENKNDSSLELADLIIEYPQGSFSEEGESLKYERFSLGNLKPNSLTKKTISFVLFGKEDEEKVITAALEYRLAQSNAIFEKEKTFTIKISRPTIGVSISMPNEINARQEMEIEISLVSNSEAVIKNLIMRTEYPSGFQFVDASPQPSKEDDYWIIGDLQPSQERKILIRGVIEGQDLEEKAFRVFVGTINEDGDFFAYGSGSETVLVKRPFVGLTFYIDGKNTSENIAFPGDDLRVDVEWQNNLDVPVENAVIEVEIRGEALDEGSISVRDGFYRSFDKKMVWNYSTLKELVKIRPGERNRVGFSFSVLKNLPIKNASDKNFIITIKGKISGIAVIGGVKKQQTFSEIEKEVKIGSRLQAVAIALHYTGPFKNTGPMPPQVGKETTYTITWSLGNNINDFRNVRVKTILPPYVRWTGRIEPGDEKISFDEKTGEVIWEIDELPAGTGIIMPAREVSFQIGFVPSANQVGQTPKLIMETSVEAKDVFTQQILNFTLRALNTSLENDPQFRFNEASVVE